MRHGWGSVVRELGVSALVLIYSWFLVCEAVLSPPRASLAFSARLIFVLAGRILVVLLSPFQLVSECGPCSRAGCWLHPWGPLAARAQPSGSGNVWECWFRRERPVPNGPTRWKRVGNKARKFWLWETLTDLEGAAPACVPLYPPHVIDRGVQDKG